MTEVQRPGPKSTTDKDRDGKQSVARLHGGRTRSSRKSGTLPDNPNSTARRNWRSRWESNPHLPNVSGYSNAAELRVNPQPEQKYLLRSRTRSCAEGNQRSRFGKGRWTSDVIERRHSVLGIEPRALEFSPKTLRPPIWWRINDQLRPI